MIDPVVNILESEEKIEELIVNICKLIHDSNRGNYTANNKPFVPWEEFDASMKNDIRSGVIDNIFCESLSDKIKKDLEAGKFNSI